MNWQARRAVVALPFVVVALVACNNPPTGAAPGASPAAAAQWRVPEKINGKALNDAEMSNLSAALKNAGWAAVKGSDATTSTTVVVFAEKGGKTAKVTLIKHLNGNAILAADIDGKPDGVQELLDSLNDR